MDIVAEALVVGNYLPVPPSLFPILSQVGFIGSINFSNDNSDHVNGKDTYLANQRQEEG